MYKKYTEKPGRPDRLCCKILLIMRLTTVLLMASMLQVNASGFAQKINLSKTNVPLKTIIRHLRLQSGYDFVYNNKILAHTKPLSVDFKNIGFIEALDQVFGSQSLTYTLEDKTVVVRLKQSAAIGKLSDTDAKSSTKQIKVRGTVTDTLDIALSGVVIKIKGKSNAGTATDVNGKYAITAAGTDTLIFSYVGFEHAVVAVNGKDVVNVVLKELPSALKELVIVGFGTQKKVTVTGAVSQVSAKDIQKQPVAAISNALGGSLPGIITRQSSGEPGADQSTIAIRGLGTWVNSRPLVLVDGIERTLDWVNPTEIESITLLKDASATAVYGLRSANGVILITTKRGAEGKPRVSFFSQSSMTSSLRVPEYIGGYEYASLANEALKNDGKNPAYTAEDLQKYQDGSDPWFHPNVNWMDEILNKNAFQYNNNLSVSGGNKTARYYMSLGALVQNGVFKEDDLQKFNTNATNKRYNFRANVDVNVSSDISLFLSVGSVQQARNFPGVTADGIFNAIKTVSPISFPKVNPDGSVAGKDLLIPNPYGYVTQSGYNSETRNNVQSIFEVKWNLGNLLFTGLSARIKYSYDHNNQFSKDRIKPYAIKQYTGKDSNGEDQYITYRNEAPLGYANSSAGTSNQWMEAAVNYDRAFGRNNVNAMLIHTISEKNVLITSNSIAALPYRTMGYAARMTYNFDERYLAELNAGYMGSENFMKGKRFGFFPSVSVGWVPTREKFWNGSSAISFMKIRASYGKVGNDQIGDNRFLFLSTINKNQGTLLLGQSQVGYVGYGEGKTGYENVSWESSRKADIGLDLEMWNGNFVLQADVFHERRTGILMQRQQVPAYIGFLSGSVPFGNIGIIENKGFDAQVTYKKTVNSKFFYSVSGNITYSKNKIIDNDSPVPLYPNLEVKGKSIGSRLAFITEGFYQDQEDINNSPANAWNPKPGDLKFKDLNGDNKIDLNDQTYLGYPRFPQVIYGITPVVRYKGFEVSALIQGAAQTNMFLNGASIRPYVYGSGRENILGEYYANRWVAGADNSNAKYPRIGEVPVPISQQQSSSYMRDASYIRIKNAQFAYSLPKRFLPKYMTQVRISVTAQNLLTFDKLKFLDPESDDGTGQYPIQRVLSFGLEIGL
ncbi:TonB-dependent receptor plug [Pedobacter heparinus DSM 2366]|uniref:TonB-dependent receptor plug n=2 Tax=Pedobacter heparinus TaxID=984 RepID=C6Y0D0_PEDHD|nr:TonB-dependent receptor plug [Pedobacter heparinus DSM 2366]